MKPKIFLVLLFLLPFGAVFSQNQTELVNRIDSLELQLKELQEKFLEKEKSDKRKALLERAKQLSTQKKKESGDISKKFRSGVRQQQGLNPNISVGGDFYAAFSSSSNENVTESSDFAYGSDNFFMRELELAFVAPLDPFTRGKAFISVTEEGAVLEEGYMELINLPLNINLKAGVFKAEYGLLNRYHPHALPQFDKPKVLMYHFGEPGIGGPGLAANIMLPKLPLADASSLDISVVHGGNGFSFSTEHKINALYIGHFKNYFDINENSYFEYTISGVGGYNDDTGDNNSYVGSLGLHYKWTPIGRAKYRTFDWKNEIIYGYHEGIAEDWETFGFYSSIQNKLSARFWLGARVGYTQLPYDNTEEEMTYALNLDFWQSDFVYFRVQYQYNDRNIENMMGNLGNMPSDHLVTFHVSWAMGPHKHEAY